MTPAELAAKLRWEPGNAEAIRENRKNVEAAVGAARAQLAAVQAMGEAVRKMCRHPNVTRYTDMSGCGCWDCVDCGESA